MLRRYGERVKVVSVTQSSGLNYKNKQLCKKITIVTGLTRYTSDYTNIILKL